MKNRIALKLTLCFFGALLLFSIIIGVLFITLFQSHTINAKKTEMRNLAAATVSSLSENAGGMSMGQGRSGSMGYGAYLRLLSDISGIDAWIVDENLELVTSGNGAMQYKYADLPKDAEAIVAEVFAGNTVFSEGFSKLLNAPTLTLGMPFYSGGQIIGAFLLHSPVEGMRETTAQGINILLISLSAALLISAFLSVLLALFLSRPLTKMKDTALMLSGGDYSVRTDVRQNDEIGQLAEALDILSGKLREAKRESEKLENLRRDFIANISHELKTPVTVIRGSLEALCDGVVADPAQIKSYYRQMLSESVFLQRLVSDLMDLSRLQNMDFSIEMEELNLCDVLNDALRSARQIALPKKIDIRLQTDRDVFLLRGDYSRLRQMFLIVLSNAVKFSPPDGTVEIVLKNRTVTVTDHGCGIDPADLPYIFDRFYKVQSEENKEGTGLGLAIARQIAQRHRASLFAASEKGRGAEFRFEF